MNDSLIVDSLQTLLYARMDSLANKLGDAQEQIRQFEEINSAVQNKYYLFCIVTVVTLVLIFFWLRHRLSVIEEGVFGGNMLDKVEALTTCITSLEKELDKQVAAKHSSDEFHTLEIASVTRKPIPASQRVDTVLASDPVAASKSALAPQSVVVKYGSIQAPDSEGVLRIADRSLSVVSSSSKWFVISYQEGSSAATYTINPDAMGEILQDLQTFQFFTEPFTLTSSTLPTHISVTHEGTLQRVERGWIVKKRLKVKF